MQPSNRPTPSDEPAPPGRTLPSGPAASRGRARRWQNAAYWALALPVMLVAAGYQRRTGPTYPVNGELRLHGQAHPYSLLTSHVTGADAPVRLPDPGTSPAGVVYWRRYPTNDPFSAVPLRVHDGAAAAALPAQPPAGKLEYYVRLETDAGTVRIPDRPGRNIIIRFKGHVPPAVLLPHVLLMFLAMLVGVRAALSALAGTPDTRTLAWTTLIGLTLGGMILGPVVQKYAFGALWTGVPFGWDLTDNKTLLMWLAWLVACVVPGLRGAARARRALVLAAAAVMLVVYLIPHSLTGSQLDYSKLDAAASAVAPSGAAGHRYRPGAAPRPTPQHSGRQTRQARAGRSHGLPPAAGQRPADPLPFPPGRRARDNTETAKGS